MHDVPEIEQQHKKLVSMLNGLNEAVKNKDSRNEIYRIIDDVIAYTRLHFEIEEQLMTEAEYPEIEAHKDKHKQLVQEALHLKEKLDHVGGEMFTDWFTHWPFARVLAHIQYADNQIKDYIHQSGVKA